MLKKLVLGCVGFVSLLTLGGCPFGDPRVTNQGGGSVLTALLKVNNNQLTTLTPDEVQLVTDLVNSTANTGVVLDDTQAADAVAFLQQHDLFSIDRVRAFADNPPAGVQVPESLRSLANANVDFSALLGQAQP